MAHLCAKHAELLQNITYERIGCKYVPFRIPDEYKAFNDKCDFCKGDVEYEVPSKLLLDLNLIPYPKVADKKA